MLQNAYFLAKIGADTAENEQHFAEILPTDAQASTPSSLRAPRGRSPLLARVQAPVRDVAGRRRGAARPEHAEGGEARPNVGSNGMFVPYAGISNTDVPVGNFFVPVLSTLPSRCL